MTDIERQMLLNQLALLKAELAVFVLTNGKNVDPFAEPGLRANIDRTQELLRQVLEG